MRRFIPALLLLIPAGCGGGGDRLDASSNDAVIASKARLMEKMTDAQKKQFADDCQTVIAVSAADFHGKRKPGPPDQSVFLKDVDGLTVAQIHEKAEAARAEMKNRMDAASKKK